MHILHNTVLCFWQLLSNQFPAARQQRNLELRCFTSSKGAPAPQACKKGLQTREGFVPSPRPISLRFGTAGSHFFWMGSARNKYWVCCEETHGLQSFPVTAVFFRAKSAYQESRYTGTAAQALLGTKLFPMFSCASFQLNTPQAEAN